MLPVVLCCVVVSCRPVHLQSEGQGKWRKPSMASLRLGGEGDEIVQLRDGLGLVLESALPVLLSDGEIQVVDRGEKVLLHGGVGLLVLTGRDQGVHVNRHVPELPPELLLRVVPELLVDEGLHVALEPLLSLLDSLDGEVLVLRGGLGAVADLVVNVNVPRKVGNVLLVVHLLVLVVDQGDGGGGGASPLLDSL